MATGSIIQTQIFSTGVRLKNVLRINGNEILNGRYIPYSH